MRVNRSNPKHLFVLGVTLLNTLAGLILRPFKDKKTQPTIILHGHKLNGNLLALFKLLNDDKNYQIYYLCFNSSYKKQLILDYGKNKQILSATNFFDMKIVARSDCIVTSHGFRFSTILKKFTDIKFIDVWHGIPYKGYKKDDFKNKHDYDGVFVSSEYVKKMYIQKFGFPNDIIKVTGYGRTDTLIRNNLTKEQIRTKYKLPKANKYLLIAPTWKQDERSRSILPFKTDPNIFFEKINESAKENKFHVILRTHINSNDDFGLNKFSNISFYPYSKFEQAEDFLLISDVLVSDWSSIVFDYLVLDRPTIFLDVPPPFKNGFSFGPEYRFGEIVGSLDVLIRSIETCMANPKNYLNKNSKKIINTKSVVYGNTLDGNCTQRYKKEIDEILKK